MLSNRLNFIRATIGCVAALLAGSSTYAEIDLELRPIDEVVTVNHVASFGLYAVSDDPETSQLWAGMEVMFTWDTDYLQMLGIDSTGGAPVLTQGFPFPDVYNINDANPPQGGQAYYFAIAPLGSRLEATPDGTLVTTFQFQTLDTVAATAVEIVPIAGNPPGPTSVFDGVIAGLNVVGLLGTADIAIIEDTCPADTNDDGEVNVLDLIAVIIAWGGNDANADINRDGVVNVTDLVTVINDWGPC